jgi:Rab5 GDP/GTP exchange factor
MNLLFNLSGLIRHLHNDEGADSFVPILIYVVVRANPEHLLSNVESVFYDNPSASKLMVTHRFINRFRNPIKLQSEAGYYLSSLVSLFVHFDIYNCVLRQILDGCGILH